MDGVIFDLQVGRVELAGACPQEKVGPVTVLGESGPVVAALLQTDNLHTQRL